VKPIELRKLTEDELKDQMRVTRQELFNLRFQRATGQLENHRQIRAARQRLARALTVMRERAAGPGEQPGLQSQA
jgi:large subunit ribosomal protein L29